MVGRFVASRKRDFIGIVLEEPRSKHYHFAKWNHFALKQFPLRKAVSSNLRSSTVAI